MRSTRTLALQGGEHVRISYQQIATMIDAVLNGDEQRKIGFALLVFEFDNTENGYVNSVSNADHITLVMAVREWLARQEGRFATEGGSA